jgi:hypothetical protein
LCLGAGQYVVLQDGRNALNPLMELLLAEMSTADEDTSGVAEKSFHKIG